MPSDRNSEEANEAEVEEKSTSSSDSTAEAEKKSGNKKGGVAAVVIIVLIIIVVIALIMYKKMRTDYDGGFTFKGIFRLNKMNQKTAHGRELFSLLSLSLRLRLFVTHFYQSNLFNSMRSSPLACIE